MCLFHHVQQFSGSSVLGTTQEAFNYGAQKSEESMERGLGFRVSLNMPSILMCQHI